MKNIKRWSRQNKMCLVSHKYKFIYVKTYKTASSSLYRLFSAYCCIPAAADELAAAWGSEKHQTLNVPILSKYGSIGTKNNGTKIENWGSHIPLSAVKRELGEKIFNSYFKFTSVRDPFDQAISMFYHINEKLKYCTEPGHVIELFHNFLKNEYDADQNWNQYAIDDTPSCDDYIRFEDLDNEINRILQILNIEPKYKVQQLRKYMPPVCGSNFLFRPYNRDLYNTMFKKELDLFGYEVRPEN